MKNFFLPGVFVTVLRENVGKKEMWVVKVEIFSEKGEHESSRNVGCYEENEKPIAVQVGSLLAEEKKARLFVEMTRPFYNEPSYWIF